jgi:hypothetical protein
VVVVVIAVTAADRSTARTVGKSSDRQHGRTSARRSIQPVATRHGPTVKTRPAKTDSPNTL